MKRFHASHERIETITETGVFGGLFAADEQSAMSHAEILHVIHSPRPLTDFALNYEIEGAYEAALDVARGNERIADAIMDRDCTALDDCADAGEQGWEFQRLRGKLAAKLGYTSVEMRDEHGTVWLCLPGCTVEIAE